MPAKASFQFNPACRACPRLARHLAQVRRDHPDYHAAPVAPFGDRNARLLIVGLAPGMHGANRTGRPFTGDHAGILLYETLHRHGLASRAEAVARNDGLTLKRARITNAVKCLPPANKPLPAEIRTCRRFLAHELAGLKPGSVVLALGGIAHQSVLRARGLKPARYPFRHGAVYELPDGLQLVSSYHCSRYNTQTRRLTPAMFDRVVRRAKDLFKNSPQRTRRSSALRARI
jgi:uracil-DNA glycosylase family 4